MLSKLRATATRKTRDNVWERMLRGMKPDGTKHPLPPPSKDRYIFLTHQNKRERRRRLRQAYAGVISVRQFFDAAEYQEAQEMHVMLEGPGKAA